MKICKTEITLPSGDKYIADLDASLRIVSHFTIDELANWSCKEDVKFIITPESLTFMQRIEEFRRWYNKPIIVNSCYRSKSFNASLEGAINKSEHLSACALDWKITGHTNAWRNKVKEQIFKQARQYGCGCHVIYYKWGYHIDFAGTTQTVIDRR